MKLKHILISIAAFFAGVLLMLLNKKENKLIATAKVEMNQRKLKIRETNKEVKQQIKEKLKEMETVDRLQIKKRFLARFGDE